MSRNEKIGLVTFIILAGFVAAVVFHYCAGKYCKWSYPYDTFLFTPADAFNDFFNFYRMCKNRNPYFEPGVPSLYFPLADLIFCAFARLPKNLSFALYSAAFAMPVIGLTAWQLRGGSRYEYAKNVLICALLTYPFLFTLDRGNNDGFLFVPLCAFALMDDSRPLLRSLLLAIPIAMKVYPGVFLLILLGDKRYKEIAFTLLWVVVLSAVSLLCFRGGFMANIHQVLEIFRTNERLPAYAWNNQTYHSVGLFFPMKIMLREVDRYLFPVAIWDQVKVVYRLGVLISLGLLSLYILFIERERWKKIALLVFAMLLLPEMSCDYRLLHVLIPLFLFINAPRQGKGDRFYAWAMALLLIPKSYYFLPHITTSSGHMDFSIGAVINPLIMVVMSTVIIVSGLRQWRASGQPAPLAPASPNA